jgi:hypothetical protein
MNEGWRSGQTSLNELARCAGMGRTGIVPEWVDWRKLLQRIAL